MYMALTDNAKSALRHSTRTAVCRRRLVTSVAAIALALTATRIDAQAVPVGEPPFSVQPGGNATFGISPDGLIGTVTQSTQRAVLNWPSLSVELGKTLVFAQPDASSVTLNRVAPGSPSFIDGTISANGQVWILNPSGVFVGWGGRINTAGFLATTGDISDADFMAGSARVTISSVSDAPVVNRGKIHADNGYVILAGNRVENGFTDGTAATAGLITANLGTIALAGGRAFTLDFAGDKLLSFVVTEPMSLVDAAPGGIVNAGTLAAEGGTIIMRARAALDSVTAAINTTGLVQAQTVSVSNGRIILDAGTGGKINASREISTAGAVPGGGIDVIGDLTVTGPTALMANGSINIAGTLSAKGGPVGPAGSPVGNIFINANDLTLGGLNLSGVPLILKISNTGVINGQATAGLIQLSGGGSLRLTGPSNQIDEILVEGATLIASNTGSIAGSLITLNGGRLRAESSGAAATLSNEIRVNSFSQIELEGPAEWTLNSNINNGGSADASLLVGTTGNLLLGGQIGGVAPLRRFEAFASGSLTLGTNATITTQDRIILSGAQRFVNDAVATNPLNAGLSFWLVWSGNTTPFAAEGGDRIGGLVHDFRAYDVSRAQITGEEPLPILGMAGNGLLYSLAPSLTVSAGAEIKKVYDGTDAAIIPGGLRLAISGAVNGDTIGLNLHSARFDQPDVTATMLVLEGSTVRATDSAGKMVLGYKSPPPMIFLPATITPKALTLTGSVSRVYDGTSIVTLDPANLLLEGLVADQSITIGTLLGNLASANVGDKLLVTAPLAASDLTPGTGTLLSNYLLPTSASGVIARITPRPLTVTLVDNVQKAYDGTTTATLTAANLSLTGLASGDDIGLTLGEASYASANVGSGILVSASLSPANYVARGTVLLSNYLLPGSTSAAIGTIAPLRLTYVAAPVVRLSAQSDPIFTGTVTGFLTGEDLHSATTGDLLFETSALTSSPAGQYPILGAGLTAPNYVFEQAPENATALTITANITKTISSIINSPTSSVTFPPPPDTTAAAPPSPPASSPTESESSSPESSSGGTSSAPPPATTSMPAAPAPTSTQPASAPAPAPPVETGSSDKVVVTAAPPVEPTPPSPVPSEPEPVASDTDDADDPILRLASDERPAAGNAGSAPSQTVQITPQISLQTGSLETQSAPVDTLQWSMFVPVGM